MNKSDKFFEVKYETNQEGWRTRWAVKARTKDRAIGYVCRMVTQKTMTKGVWFRPLECNDVTEGVRDGSYKQQQPSVEFIESV